MADLSIRYVLLAGVLLASTATVGACARTPSPDRQAAASSAKPAATPAAEQVPSTAAQPLVVVHKSESCGCCGLWVKHLEAAGFSVQVHNQNDLHSIKERVGVPLGQGSCHTAEVGGYFVEGHVPAEDIKRLLAERPEAKGLVLAGMPLGSPGMEVPSGEVQPYVVSLVQANGTMQPYAQHGQ